MNSQLFTPSPLPLCHIELLTLPYMVIFSCMLCLYTSTNHCTSFKLLPFLSPLYIYVPLMPMCSESPLLLDLNTAHSSVLSILWFSCSICSSPWSFDWGITLYYPFISLSTILILYYLLNVLLFCILSWISVILSTQPVDFHWSAPWPYNPGNFERKLVVWPHINWSFEPDSESFSLWWDRPSFTIGLFPYSYFWFIQVLFQRQFKSSPRGRSF